MMVKKFLYMRYTTNETSRARSLVVISQAPHLYARMVSPPTRTIRIEWHGWTINSDLYVVQIVDFYQYIVAVAVTRICRSAKHQSLLISSQKGG